MKLVISRLLAVFALSSVALASQSQTLNDIAFSELPGERAELRMTFDSTPPSPKGYAIDQPARIVLDFQGVENGLPKKKYPMSVGAVSSAVVLAGGNRTRVIVNLDSSVPYASSIEGNTLVVVIGAETAGSSTVAHSGVQSVQAQGPVIQSTPIHAGPSSSSISKVDFRRGELGEGKVIVSLTNPNVNIDVEEVSGGIEVKFVDTELPTELRRKLDVVDFATPVKMLGAKATSEGSLLTIEATGDYDYLAYQADSEYVVSIKPLTQREIEEKKKKFAYTGERLSLNFQDIQVRSVLQLIADFTELNLVASDTVSGSITLRLDNVPWDQALDIVLKSKGLDKRQVGNVLMVAPAAEIAERERQEIETQKQLQELAPLRTEYIRIRYANAKELFSLFSDAGGNAGSGSNGTGQSTTGSILSDRGQAIVDERTNSIILTDTEEKINEFKELVDRIDIPVRQVMIEARIVIANTDFRKELGVRISGDAAETSRSGDRLYEFTGRQEGLLNDSGVGGPAQLFVDSDGDGVSDGKRNLVNSRLVDLGVFNPTGAFSWNIIGSNFLLGMELSALQNSGFAEIVSQPKVITGDKQLATIESGTQIPYQEESASGGTTTAFKDAVLKLEVTPQITPDNRVIMDLVINQDSVSAISSANIPVIDVTKLETQVLVSDGETVVLGGIYQTETIQGQEKVPLLGDIPVLGRLFRKDIQSEDKKELLLFVTPKIMSSSFVE
ncbi:type IV pilus secretin PilQ [Teredinibacter sp. KSP-S5-2]|uniref:type IV pilus secretin PilQ n=1 Tax=Teredinibacter sp. KSP-S5-2 TaxID=3034506 RepID=UPI0029351A77|nr:type IV pilus secretin PilQ [Teredinibacter sp. KSP-S5-2]WNO08192.1 type IV pilus secretin PilQ [Teredinibacter sp. KSP-S5-2]